MRKRFRPPTLKEIQQYISENPKLHNIDVEAFFRGYNDADPAWHDTHGKPVRNWKLKLWTWSRFNQGNKGSGKTKLYPIRGKVCEKCTLPAVYIKTGSAYDHPYCAEHMPKEVKEKYE